MEEKVSAEQKYGWLAKKKAHERERECGEWGGGGKEGGRKDERKGEWHGGVGEFRMRVHARILPQSYLYHHIFVFMVFVSSSFCYMVLAPLCRLQRQ